MAISVGKVTDENASGFSKQLFTGMTPVKILAINPTKQELEKIYGRELEKEPEYVTADEKGVKKVRIDFIVQLFPNEKLGVTIDTIEKIPFFVEDNVVVGSESGKYQIINKWGDSAWATKDEFVAKKINGGQARFRFDGARQAFVGEVALVNFLRKFLNIDSPTHWSKEDNAFIYRNDKDLANCEIMLENIKKYFIGDVKEIKDAIKMMPNNVMKVPAGIKTTDDNKQYIGWFTDEPLIFESNSYSYVYKKIAERKKMLNVDFGPEDLKFRLYSNEPTVMEQKAVEAAPSAGFWAD